MNERLPVIISYIPDLKPAVIDKSKREENIAAMKSKVTETFNKVASVFQRNDVEVKKELWIAQCVSATVPAENLSNLRRDLGPNFEIRVDKPRKLIPEAGL